MTADIELLPLPEWCHGCGESLPRDMQTYARAVAKHNIRFLTHELANAECAIDAEQAGRKKAEAEIEALRDLCGAAYQLAGVHDAPEVWLDALSAAASGHPFSTDGLLPYMPDAVCEAEAHAERLAEALREMLVFYGERVDAECRTKDWRELEAISAARAALRDHDQEGKDG